MDSVLMGVVEKGKGWGDGSFGGFFTIISSGSKFQKP